MNINYEHYKVFYYVASQGSITMAAHCLYISQPAVSKAIALLEKEIGVPLFLRQPSGMVLTDEGAVLYEHISKAYNEIVQAETNLQNMMRPRQNTIYIAAEDLAIRYSLLPIIQSYTMEYPDEHINIYNRCTESIIDMVRKGNADIGFIPTPIKHYHDLDVYCIEKYQICFVASPAIVGNQTKLTLDQFVQYPFIISRCDTPGAESMINYMTKNNLASPSRIEVGSLDLVHRYAATGMGIGLSLIECVDEWLDDEELTNIQLDCPYPEVQLCAIVRKGEKQSTSLENFFDLLLPNF